MNKSSKTSIDQTYKNTFEHFETDFNTSDWDNMLNLLEEDTGIVIPPVSPINKHPFTNIKNLFIMILLATLTSAIFWASNPISHKTTVPLNQPVHTELSTSSKKVVTNDNPLAAKFSEATENALTRSEEATDRKEESESKSRTNQPALETTSTNQQISETTSTPVEPPANQQTTDKKEVLENTKDVQETVEKLVSVVDTAKFLKKVVSRYWVDTTYRYIYEKPSRDIEQGWFGLYFTHQQFTDTDDWDSIGRNRENAGFNIQMMSGNILPGENVAIYGGLDWGMQFLGRSANDEVLLNSVNEDRGLTFLRSHTNDIFVTGHFEYTQFPIVPYFSAGFGTRILTTGQTTRALLSSTEYESSQDNGVHTRAALATKFGLGVKFKLSPRVYLDARYELFQTNKINTVDYSTSVYNGLSYDLGLRKMNLSADQFRFGVVFDVSEGTRKKVVDQPGHWEEQEQTLYVDPSDSTKVFVPCPCDKPKKTKRTQRNNSSSNEPSWPRDNSPNNGGIFNPGSGSGTGKSPFPGTKKPPVRW